ncbi:MAG: DUF2845 domain-containing protein [Pseudomonadota bacterium]
MRLNPIVLAGLLMAVALAPAARADAMRCGQNLVRDGDPQSKVLALCGEPSGVQRRTVLRRPYFDLQGRFVYFGDGLVEVPVEIWTYNLGPQKLIRRVRFVDGIVDAIETLGHGYREY